MIDWLRDLVGTEDDETEEIAPGETIDAFERFLESEDVTVKQDNADLVDQFADIVGRYDDIRPEIRRAREEIGDGDSLSLYDVVRNEEFDSWQEDNQSTLAEIESLNEDFRRLLEDIDLNESEIDTSGPISEVNRFYKQVHDAVWLTT